MKDIIWTIIVIWFVYKLVAVIKGKPGNKTQDDTPRFDPQNNPSPNARQNPLNNEGEYVDYEEIK